MQAPCRPHAGPMQVKKAHDWRMRTSGESPNGPAGPPGRGTGGVGLVSLDTIKLERLDLHASTHRGSADYPSSLPSPGPIDWY